MTLRNARADGETVSDKIGLSRMCRQLLTVRGAAAGVAICRSAVLAAGQWAGPEIDLLAHLVRDGNGAEFPAAFATDRGGRIKDMDLVELLRSEGSPEVRLVTGLAADTAFNLWPGRGGLTKSDEGGLDELQEFFLAASLDLRRSFFALRSAFSRSKTSSRFNRTSRRDFVL